MYKCTECGLEFETKPDYCDCGNDEFVLTVKEEEKPAEKAPIAEVKQEPERKVVSAEEFFNKQNEQKTYYDNYSSQKNRFKLTVSPFALFIFVICLLLSLIILLLWNPVKETTEKITQVIEKTENIAIPSIDKLWKNPTPVKQETKTVKQENTVKSETKVTILPSNKTTSAPKTVTKPVSKSVSKPVAKPASSGKAQSKPVTKPTVNNKPAQTVKPPQQVQTKADEQAKKAQEEAKKAQEAKAKAEAEALAAAEQARKNAQAKQELHSYKINLRNAIAQKIDFTRVIGDGDCAVTFKVDSSGRLANRAFAKQSSNITLNNAVYNAVMSVPSFNPPPSLYNNETLRLTIKFNNGNFAITLE